MFWGVCLKDNNPSGQQEWRASVALTVPPSEGEKRVRGREGGRHVVNTCSLRGDWSSANLFTYRLTTQEPLFLPLPCHPPFIPRYLTFPFLASPAGRLPSSLLPCLFCLFQTLPTFLLPMFSNVISPFEWHLSFCSSCDLFLAYSDTRFFLFPARLTRTGIRSVSASFWGLRYFS